MINTIFIYYRYLIFFDIGYSQYVHHSDVNLVLSSSINVWEDVFVDSRPFIKKYLESQDRPMVKLAKDQTVRVEYNGELENGICYLLGIFALSLREMVALYCYEC